MEDKITNIKERILLIAENKGIAKEKFFQEIGMTYGNFKGKSKLTPINSNAIVDIIAIHSDINLEWLLTGKGEMFVSPGERTSFSVVEDTSTNYSPGDSSDDDMKVKIIIEVNGETKEKVIQLLSGNDDLSFLKK